MPPARLATGHASYSLGMPAEAILFLVGRRLLKGPPADNGPACLSLGLKRSLTWPNTVHINANCERFIPTALLVEL